MILQAHLRLAKVARGTLIMIHESKYRATESRRRVMAPSIVARKSSGPEYSGTNTLRSRLGNQGVQRLMSEIVGHSTGGAQTRYPAIQTKPTVSHPDDAHEREADRVADVVMRTTGRGSTSTSPSMPTVQRVCADCEEEISTRERADHSVVAGDPTPVHRSASAYGASQVSAPVAASIHDMQGGGGAPLPEQARTFFEPRFGADFSHVRVHTGGRADSTAKAINAKAFTVGSDIVFAGGQLLAGIARRPASVGA